jgi:drug/metabolite transporter (DMT)-like permease
MDQREQNHVKSRHVAADIQLSLAALLAGSGWLFSINALKELPPLLFMGSRFLIAGLLIGLLTDFRSLRGHSNQLSSLLPAAAALALAMMFWIIGLKQTTNPGVAAFIAAMGNLLVPVFGLLLFRWPVGRGIWLSLALALVGMSLLFLDRGAHVDDGHIYFIISAGLWAISIALVKRNSVNFDPVVVTSIQLAVSGLIILLVSLVVEELPRALPTGAAFGWFLVSILLSTCLRFFLQFRGQQLISAGRAAILMCFEPVWTMLLSMSLLGTVISLPQAIGCGIIFFAITREMLLNRKVG